MRKQASIPQGQSVGPDPRRIARTALAAYIKAEIADSTGKPLAVLMVNLSRSKQFEPITRVSAWESTLRQIDVRIAQILRAPDRYARLSDEKLCAVLPGLANGTQAVLAAIRILSALKNPLDAEAKGVPVRASVGIAICPDHGRDADELVSCADIAAHIAVESEDGYHVIRPEDRSEAGILYGDIEGQLLHAIGLNELPVHYQPQIEISTGRCVGAEALLRWKASGVSDVSPGAAISIAEHAGFIAPLTFAVINTVLRHAADFRRKGVHVNLSVNISTQMLADVEMPDIVQQAIGTGDSSLAYMKRFPVHELKIDKMFVANMLTSRGDQQIVRSVIDLSHNFSLQAVAEGVENGQTFDELKAMGCDIAQGYLFSRALPYDEFVLWLKAWRA